MREHLSYKTILHLNLTVVTVYLAHLCLTLCDPMEYSFPGSFVYVYNCQNPLMCSLNICASYYILTSIKMYVYVTFVSLSSTYKRIYMKIISY